MKKILFIIATILLMSCNKDIKGKCGVVLDRHIGGSPEYRAYLLQVDFGNGFVKNVPVPFNDWFNYDPGEKICF